MSETRPFPESALAWLAGDGERLLALGRSSTPLLTRLSARSAAVTATATTFQAAHAQAQRAPGVVALVADPYRLPFSPTSFDTVVVHQSLHQMDAGVALPEIARVLRPGGRLSVAYTVRDDSVPWVRRLIALLRDVDETAMAGAYGAEATDALHDNPYFPEVEAKNFRLWMPISRIDLLNMVARRFPDLEPGRLKRLMVEVGSLYESSARAPEPLLLPYQVQCWRAWVSHDEFTSQIRPATDGLRITL